VEFLFFFCFEGKREIEVEKRTIFSLRFEEREKRVNVGGEEVRVCYTACRVIVSD